VKDKKRNRYRFLVAGQRVEHVELIHSELPECSKLVAISVCEFSAQTPNRERKLVTGVK